MNPMNFRSKTVWAALLTSIATPVMTFLGVDETTQQNVVVALGAIVAIFLRDAISKVQK